MLKQIDTTDVAEIQHYIERYNQGTGPAILAQFMGKGSTDLVAIRKTGKYLEGQYPACREDEWYQVTLVFYETDDLKRPQSEPLLHQLLPDQANIQDYIVQLEKLLEDYRTFLISINFEKPEEIRHKRMLLEQTYALIGSNLENSGSVKQ